MRSTDRLRTNAPSRRPAVGESVLIDTTLVSPPVPSFSFPSLPRTPRHTDVPRRLSCVEEITRSLLQSPSSQVDDTARSVASTTVSRIRRVVTVVLHSYPCKRHRQRRGRTSPSVPPDGEDRRRRHGERWPDSVSKSDPSRRPSDRVERADETDRIHVQYGRHVGRSYREKRG